MDVNTDKGADRPVGLKGLTIYMNPSDHPGQFVCRAWRTRGGEVEPSDAAVIFPVTDVRTLQKVRREMQAKGAIRFPRAPQDDPVILETWM